MSFCPQCQTYLADKVKVCPLCGAAQPPAEAISLRWSASLGGTPSSAPLISGDLALVAALEDDGPAQRSTLYAFNLADGRLRWQHHLAHAHFSGLAARSAGPAGPVIFAATTSADLLHGEGEVLALNAAGQVNWRWTPGVQRVSAPALAGEVIGVTTDTQRLYLLEAVSGQERASIGLSRPAATAAPALSDAVAYVPCRSPHLLAVSWEGRLLWQFEAQGAPGTWLDRTPALAGDKLIAVLSTGVALALRRRDGSLLWQVNLGSARERLSAPVAHQEQVYIGGRDGLHLLNAASGQQIWKFSAKRRVEAPPVLANGLIFVTCHDHHLYVLDANTRRELGRYAGQRRVELSPAVSSSAQSGEKWALVADAGGTLVALTCPPTAADHAAAGRWVDAASIYAGLGQYSQAAELLAAHGEPFKAGQLWEAAKKWEQAATQYEVAGAWQRAAELWERLGHSLKRAEALAHYAQTLSAAGHSAEEQAEAWEAAAQAFESEGETERAAAYQLEVAKYRKQPIIRLDVKHEGLVLQTWSKLQFVVRNEGFGSARFLTIHAAPGDEFEGQVMSTQQIAHVPAGQERVNWLDIYPREPGDSVPLRVKVTYQDQGGQMRSWMQTLYLSVASTQAGSHSGQIEGVTAKTASHDMAVLRELLMTAFSDGEIRRLAYDHFRKAYGSMGSQMGLDALVDILVEYSDRHLQVDELLKLVQDINPARYAQYAPRLKKP